MKITTEDRGWAGHFFMSDRCNFRRNTLVSYGDKHIVVSTVGDCRVDGKPIEIGHHRYYETMMFWSQLELELYLDADITKKIVFTGDWSVSKLDKESDKEANTMHENAVIWAKENIKSLKVPKGE